MLRATSDGLTMIFCGMCIDSCCCYFVVSIVDLIEGKELAEGW